MVRMHLWQGVLTAGLMQGSHSSSPPVKAYLDTNIIYNIYTEYLHRISTQYLHEAYFCWLTSTPQTEQRKHEKWKLWPQLSVISCQENILIQ